MAPINCPTCQTILPTDSALADVIVACPHCGANHRMVNGALDEPPVSGGDGTNPVELEPVEEGISLLEADVLAELDRLQNQQPSWAGALAVLAISLFLYVGAAQAEGPWDGILLLIPVLAFHELGHYLAMRVFGYRNLRMFFIPFFGAAVSGQKYNIAGWKKAVVALAGPLPGILLGVPLGILGLSLNEPKLVEGAMLLLILNGFNLLPLLPLDGGWVVHAVLFVRHPLLDGVFRLLAGLALLGLAFLLEAWLLAALAVFMLLAVPLAFRLARAAYLLKQEGLAAWSADAESIPPGAALAILAAVRPVLPAQATPKVMAQNVANVFETLNAHPPGIPASLVLLAVHAGGFLVALVMSVVLTVLKQPPV